jgi:hypothetical protein
MAKKNEHWVYGRMTGSLNPILPTDRSSMCEGVIVFMPVVNIRLDSRYWYPIPHFPKPVSKRADVPWATNEGSAPHKVFVLICHSELSPLRHFSSTR